MTALGISKPSPTFSTHSSRNFRFPTNCFAYCASLAALDVNHHALAIDVPDFQMGQLGVAHSGGVERHQQNAMVGSERRIDEPRDFFLAQDRRKVQGPFRIGSLGDAAL